MNVKPTINEECNFVRAATIGDAWRDIMNLCLKNGYNYKIEHGSYKDQVRKQLEHATIVITNPGQRPLSPIMPPNIPPPTDDEAIGTYAAKYILGDELEENDQYTYGSFIVPQVPRIIEILNESKGNSNQAAITIADKESCYLEDPPCLRSVHFKVVDGKLNMTILFRSWDLFSGLPENLGGLQTLKEFVLAHLDFECVDGMIICYSDGLHIYEMYTDVVQMLNIEKVEFDV